MKDATGADTLVIQGDVSYDLSPFLVSELGIPKDKVRAVVLFFLFKNYIFFDDFFLDI